MAHRFLALALFCLAGCGGAQRAEPVPPAGPAIYVLALEHRSEMSQAFRLVGLRAHVGDRMVFEQNVDAEDGSGDAEIETPRCLYRARVPAGSHEVTLELVYRGRGYGVFSYVSGYRFRVRSRHTLDVSPIGYGVQLTSIGSENGGVTTPLEERPSVRWVERQLRGELDNRCGAGG